MNRNLASALVLTLALAACGPAAAPPASQPANAANAAANAAAPDGMAGMSGGAPAAPVMAHGTGRVTAIDLAAGSVTIDHGPIPAASWPAMVMAFHATPAALTGIAVGDQVAFDVTISGGGGEVTAIHRTR